MRKIFNLITILIIASCIGNAQNITNAVETNPILCNGETTQVTVTTDVVAPSSLLPLTYNLSQNLGTPTAPFWFEIAGPITSSTGVFNTQPLAPDQYKIDIVDGSNNLISTWVIDINAIPPFVQASFPVSTSANVSCNGANDGSITTYLTGGTPPYDLTWSGPVGFTETAMVSTTSPALPPGTYTCILEDANDCPFQGGPYSVTITENPVLDANANTTSVPVACYGQSTGEATVNPTGGTGSGTYSYLWSPSGGTGQTATGLSAGPYTCEVTDGNGCVDIATVTITEPLDPITIFIEPSNYNGFGTSCYDMITPDGTATALVSGGTIGSGYTYVWAESPSGINIANPLNLDQIIGLAAGDYVCTVTDAVGCPESETVTITEPLDAVNPSSIVTSNYNGQEISCNGASDGEGTASAIGGTPSLTGSPYTYEWNTNPIQYTDIATGLNVAGSPYTCMVTDANGCSNPTTLVITEPLAIDTLSTFSTPTNCNGDADGSATVTADPSTGTPPFSYSWNDILSQQTQTAINLTAQSYECEITDINGCSSPLNPVIVTVNEPDLLVATVSQTINVSCTGESDGEATVSVTGGTEGSGYTYQWATNPAPGTIISTNSTATGLSGSVSGISYTCTVTDINGCQASHTATITEPANLPTAILTSGWVSCLGGSDGEVNAVASGGTSNPPYTYTWTDANSVGIGSSPTGTETGLEAGIYTCVVLDGNGCPFTADIEVFEPSTPLTASVTMSEVSCNGVADGGAMVFPTGGIPGYYFSWTGPDPSVATNTTSSISGVVAGTYECKITDDNGCTITEIINLIDPPLLEITIITPFNPTCTGFSDGSLTASVIGGALPYTYLWDDPLAQTTPTADFLTDLGSPYTCVVTDANGCSPSTATMSESVTDPTLLTIMPSPMNVMCTGDATGSISLLVNGGTQNVVGDPYTYVWNNGTTSNDNTLLIAGTYSCVVEDANGCIGSTGPITIGEPANSLGVSITVLNDETCNGFGNGTAIANVTGGTLNYNYLWNNTATSQMVSALSAGGYTVDVTDANGCEASASTTINAASVIDVTPESNSPTCNSTTIGVANDGTATVNVSGGAGGYTYSWDDGQSQTTATASALIAGTYNCTIFDVNGCPASAQVIVPEPSPDITATFSNTHVACFGASTGASTINAIGGTAPLDYSWSPTTSNSTSIQNQDAGTYVCNVSDATGCITPFTTTINTSPALTTTLSTIQMSVAGANDGSMSVVPNGGTGSGTYTYSWSSNPGGLMTNTTASINMLSAAIYTVIITDNNNCSITVTDQILDPLCDVQVNDNISTISCNGDLSTVWWENTNGLQPYTNELIDPNGVVISNTWPTNQFQSNLTAPLSLSAGVYNLTVTDANNCQEFVTLQVVEPADFEITLTSTDVLCHGEFTGTASAVLSGGTIPYGVIDWAEQVSGSPATPSGLQAGTYTVSALDANGCEAGPIVFVISEPAAALDVSIDATLVGCFPTNNGTATALPTGGTGPGTYSYSWGTGDVTATISSLSAGTYSCTVTDDNGCTFSISESVLNAPPLDLTITGVDPSCNNGSNGQITTSMNTGTLPITYNWEDNSNLGVSISNADAITGLSAGIYNLEVIDAWGCTPPSPSIQSIVLNNPSSISIVINTVNPNLNGASTGQALVTSVTGGSGVYVDYQWQGSGGFIATTQDIVNIPSGTYTLIVTDDNGCIGSNTVNIIDPACAVVSTNTITQPQCCGDVGSISWTNSGGQSPYLTQVVNSLTMMPYAASTTNPSNTSLPAGDYYLSTEDAYGCLSPAYNFSIVEPLCLGAIVVVDSVSCAPGQGPNNDGSVITTAIGGTPPYDFDYVDLLGNPININALDPGSYVVTVTDDNGCVSSPLSPIGFNILEPNPITIANPITTTPVSINGSADGTATATVTGGTPNLTGDPYDYLWSPSGEITNPSVSLFSGIQTLLVTDANGCTETEIVDVLEPLPVALSFIENDALCFGDANGNAEALPTGGVGPFTYLWDNGQTTPIATFLVAGTYLCTVTDANGATFSASAVVGQPAEMDAVLTTTNVTCNGDADGTAQVAPTGCSGVACDILWWNGSTNTSVPGLFPIPGTHWVTITNTITNCSIDTVFEITEPDPLSVIITVEDPATCNGYADGSITAEATGGTDPYTYEFINSTTAIIETNTTGIYNNSLIAGDYTVSVTDANGCGPQVSSTATILEPNPIDVTESIVCASCNGLSDGSITINVTGENDDFTYLWNVTGSTTTSSTGLAANTYSVLITPTNGCPPHTELILMCEPDALDLTDITPVDVSCFGENNGSISLIPTGGTGAGTYSYLWSDGQVTSTAINLVAGTYTCEVTDNNGCTETTAPIPITQPALVTTGLDTTDISCFGLSDGSAEVNPTGVTGASYAVSWNFGPPSNINIVPLQDGTHYVEVINTITGCSSGIEFFIIEEPAQLLASSNYTEVSCYGGSNGSAEITNVSGGSPIASPIYYYSWENDAFPGTIISTNSMATGLQAGSYTCIITDGLPQNTACFITENIIITEADQILSGLTTVPVSCVTGQGTDDDGSATVSPTGGTPFLTGNPYTYLWTVTNSTTSSSSGYSPSIIPTIYTVTITDSLNCSEIFNVDIPAATSLTFAPSSTPVTCFDYSDGTATMGVSGGTGVGTYTYLWSNLGTTSSITSLNAGTYTCQVTDQNGCLSSDNVVVTQPTEVEVTVTTTDVTCNGAQDGEASIVITGGNPGPPGAYLVTWYTGITLGTNIISGLDTVTNGWVEVVDADGCPTIPAVTEFSIGQSESLLATTSVVHPSCYGYANGSLLANVTGGTLPYSYSWEDDAAPATIITTASMITGLAEGSYTCTITDANGCFTTITDSVINPLPLLANLDVTDVSCYDMANPDGQLTVNPSGSTGPYTVSWSTGSSNNTISGLSPFPAMYSVIISDGIGCPNLSLSGLTVGEPSALGLAIAVTPTTCNGDEDGQATVTPTGGTIPYTTVWSPGFSAVSPTSLFSPYYQAGNYTVEVEDANGCSNSTNFIITEPGAVEPNINLTSYGGYDITCNGGSDGQALSIPTGGNGSYSWEWSDGSVGSSINGLSATTYSVIVTDINLCTGTEFVTLIDPPAINISFTTSDYNGYEVSCYGYSDGSIFGDVSGGANGIDNSSYSWSAASNSSFTSGAANIPAVLYADTYTLTVQDNNGCSVSQDVILSEPSDLVLIPTSGVTQCNTSIDGVVSVTTSNTGVGPYDYQWNDFANQITATASGLYGATSGIVYTVTVTDANNCQETTTATVYSPSVITTSFANQTNVSCFAGNDGALSSVSSIGGTGNTYTYSLDGVLYGPAFPIYDQLPAGPFTIYTQDVNNCVNIQTFTITEPNEIIANLAELTAVNCIDTDNGVIISTPIGGTPNMGNYIFTFRDESPSIISTAFNTSGIVGSLFAGIYTVEVEDANGCFGYDTIEITPTYTLSANLTSTPVSCNGYADGTASAALVLGSSGALGNPSYSWIDDNSAVVSTSSTATGLEAGIYTCIITDNLACSITESVVVVEPSTNLSITLSSNDLNCFNSNTGSASVVAQGGVGGYIYSWMDSNSSVVSTLSTATGLAAGIYTIDVEDLSGCTQTDDITIIQPDSLYSTITSSNISCFAEADGMINLNTLGGTQQYSFLWNGPSGYLASTENISNLDVGTYSLTVTDYNECTFTDVVTITQPPLLVGVSSVISPSCYNSSDGSITLVVEGGVLPYYATYGNIVPTSISVSGDTLLFSNLSSGNQTLNLIDGNGCSLPVSVTSLLNPLELLIASTIVDEPICYEDSGDISINAIGGVLPYSYEFIDMDGLVLTSSLSTNSFIAGIYNFTLIDANGCTATENNIVLSQPDEILISETIDNVDCFGSNTGSISAVVQNAVGNPSYSWINDNLAVVGTTETATNLAAGTYVVYVYDDNGCYQTDSYSITENNEIIVDLSSTDAICSNSSDGSIEIYSIYGGVGLYDIYIDNVLFASNTDNANISELSADTFIIEISDNIGCLKTMTVEINVSGSVDCITPSIILTPDASYGTNDYWSPGLDLGSDDIEVTILNRWGQEVWNCLSLSGGNDCRFTGKNNDGALLPSTDYYYIIEYKSETQPAKTGVITLIR